MTGLERRMLHILILLSDMFQFDISFNYPFLAWYNFDFALLFDNSDHKIDIETDGTKWHKDRKQKDGYRDFLARKAGWKVLRFDENFKDWEVQSRLEVIMDGWAARVKPG